MKNPWNRLIFKIMAVFLTAITFNAIAENVPIKYTGDWLCLLPEKENAAIHYDYPHWHYGLRHWLYISMSIAIAIVQCIRKPILHHE